MERVKEVCILHCKLYMEEEEAAGCYEKEMKSYSFCVFVCTSVSHDYTSLSYKWICGSAWLSKHISSTQLYLFSNISCPSSVCVCGGLLHRPPSPTLSEAGAHALLLHHFLIWRRLKMVLPLTTNQRSHVTRNKDRGTNNNMLWLKAQVVGSRETWGITAAALPLVTAGGWKQQQSWRLNDWNDTGCCWQGGLY